jgi:hypothetical protein
MVAGLPSARRAFVTLVTNADYAMGATALMRSLALTRWNRCARSDAA